MNSAYFLAISNWCERCINSSEPVKWTYIAIMFPLSSDSELFPFCNDKLSISYAVIEDTKRDEVRVLYDA